MPAAHRLSNSSYIAPINFPAICILCIAILLIQGCTAPVGTTHVYRVNNATQALGSPLQLAYSEPDDISLIYQTNTQRKQTGDDIFAIYLTDSYLKYLQDFGGLNEVIIVAEFTESVTGDPKKDTVLKILGPYTNMADATKAPLLNKLLYGPKRMESNILNLKLQVFEYDRDENKDNAAMLDFISVSAEALSLANPVTLAEIAVAKEIGKALIAANDNDLVMSIDMDFVAGSSNMDWPTNTSVHTLPLKAGEMVLIKQEACRVGTCYDYFSKGGLNPLGYVTDAVMLAPTAVVRAITDVPDSDSLTEVQENIITSRDSGLYKKNTVDPYKDKTWLRLAVVKGGDAGYWEQRKLLWEVEADVDSMIRQKAVLDSTKVKQLGEKLQEAVEKSKQVQPDVSFSPPNATKSTQYWNVAEESHTACITLPADASNASVTLPSFTVVPATPSPAGYTCFTATPLDDSAKAQGEHLLEIRYQQGDTPRATHLTIKLVAWPELSGIPSCTTQSGVGSTIKVKVTNPEQAISWHIDGKDYSFNHTSGEVSLLLPELAAGEHNLKLRTLLGYVDSKVVTCK